MVKLCLMEAMLSQEIQVLLALNVTLCSPAIPTLVTGELVELYPMVDMDKMDFIGQSKLEIMVDLTILKTVVSCTLPDHLL